MSNREHNRRDVSPVVKIFFTIGVLAVLLFIGLFLYDRIYNDPQDVVDEYVDSFMAKSPTRIFKTLNLEMSTFLTPDNLDTLLSREADYQHITSYSLVPLTTDSDVRTYQINYMVGRLESPFSQVLTLRKTDKKKLLFLDKWEIDGTDLIGTHITVRVPIGAELIVDGRRLGENSLRSKGENSQDYEIGDMFVGKHEFEVELDGFQKYGDSFTVEAKDYRDEPIRTVDSSAMKPDLENQKVVEKLIARILPLLYKDLLERRSFDFLCQEVAIEEQTRDALRRQYEHLAERHIDTETHLTYVDFTSFDTKVTSTLSPDNCYAVRAQTKIHYTAHSTVVSGDEINLRVKSGTLKIRSTFHYSDGQWWLFDSTAFRKFIKYAKS